jgi:hypothetical protein
MRLIAFERGDGSTIYINPLQVRAVLVSNETTSYIQFDNDHVLMVKGDIHKVVRAIDPEDR